MSQQIAVRIPDEELSELDRAVAAGRFKSRAAAVRRGIELALKEHRNREIAEEYRRAYANNPQEEWIGEASVALMAEVLRDEKASQDS